MRPSSVVSRLPASSAGVSRSPVSRRWIGKAGRWSVSEIVLSERDSSCGQPLSSRAVTVVMCVEPSVGGYSVLGARMVHQPIDSPRIAQALPVRWVG